MIIFRFNARSSGQNVPAALEIAKQCGGTIDANFYKIKFDSPQDPNLAKLFDLVGNLKGTTISLESGDVVNPKKFFYAVNCNRKLICKGACTHVKFSTLSIDQFTSQYSDYIENNTLNTHDENTVLSLSEFLKPLDEDGNTFAVNKDLFLEYFREESELERMFCKNYSLLKIGEEINKLPDKIHLMSKEEFLEVYGEEEEKNPFGEILALCVIDSQLSIEDIMKCSRASTLLSGRSYLLRGNMIQDTEIYIYYFPQVNQYILLKAIMREDEPKEFKGLITKEEDHFCVKNPDFELYFQVYEGGDQSSINECFEKLKSIN